MDFVKFLHSSRNLEPTNVESYQIMPQYYFFSTTSCAKTTNPIEVDRVNFNDRLDLKIDDHYR